MKSEAQVSTCGQHHVNTLGGRLYEKSFDSVLPFHKVDENNHLAPVRKNGRAWHILMDGSDAYEERYDETFGFYCGLSTSVEDNQWFHINISGLPIYSERYLFAGNFQQDIAVVCDIDNGYFHIDKLGKPLYKSKWSYCGDFRENIAVVHSSAGVGTHILRNGNFLHDQWFQDLDVYHKGYACAQDTQGWHHIDKAGKELYSSRYIKVEPFYNGYSRVEAKCGAVYIINDTGEILRTIRSSRTDVFSELSADMVGYWKTFTIAAAVELHICEYLPATVETLSCKTLTNEKLLTRLLRALGELDIVKVSGDTWELLPKGLYLQKDNELSLVTAALEYRGDLLNRWYQLSGAIRGHNIKQNIFTDVDNSDERRSDHHAMLSSYARHDYSDIVDYLPIKDGDLVFDAAGGSGSLCEIIKNTYPKCSVVLGDMPNVINDISEKRYSTLAFDLFTEWPIRADKIILARVLHDWKDDQAVKILSNAQQALNKGGEILIIEMITEVNNFSGALCDLHLLVSTGGQERNLQHFEGLIFEAGLSKEVLQIKTDSFISILKVSK